VADPTLTPGATSAAPPRTAWATPPSELALPPGALHVWRCRLETVDDETIASLAAAERERAKRFPDERRGRLWARSRGVLRALLAGYLRTDPAAVRFGASERGKPGLSGDGSPFFNLSHSGSLAVYAFSAIAPVGVDVQRPRPRPHSLSLAARAFGSEEAARLGELPPATRERELLRAWARHEARLKCAGKGLGTGPPRADPRVWICELPVGDEATAAVACANAPATLRCWEWRG